MPEKTETIFQVTEIFTSGEMPESEFFKTEKGAWGYAREVLHRESSFLVDSLAQTIEHGSDEERYDAAKQLVHLSGEVLFLLADGTQKGLEGAANNWPERKDGLGALFVAPVEVKP